VSEQAHVHVVRGEPDELELAALVAGLVAASSATPDEPDTWTGRSAWADRRHGVRPAGWRPSADAWRWSLR
jgi:hypothetical protein